MIFGSTVFAAVFILGRCICTPVEPTDVILKFSGLDPENGASQPMSGMVYFSSTYKASIVKYNPIKESFKEILIPSVTGNPVVHVSGIEADRTCSLVWAIVDAAAAFATSGGDLSGPARILGINSKDEVVYNIDLLPVLGEVQRLNGGHKVGGTQDSTTDHDGNVYVIFTCGQVIVKIDKKTRKPAVWFAQKNPAPRKMSYTGIELADENTLIVWNDNTHQFETFDLRSSNPQPLVICPKNAPKSIMGDAIFMPTFSKGTCVLLSNDETNSIEVFTTKDDWKSVTHTTSIVANKFGGHPSFTLEINSKIHYGVFYLPNEKRVSQSGTPLGDITDEVRSACAL